MIARHASSPCSIQEEPDEKRKDEEAMTENMKKLAELISSLDREAMEKASRMSKDELIAFAAEKGITLTDADFDVTEDDKALSMDDLAASAGGDHCGCVVGGGGLEDLSKGEKLCACAIVGEGATVAGPPRCFCPAVGGGRTEGF